MGVDEKIACAINVVVGAIGGFIIYMLGLGGWKFLLIPKAIGHWWNGWLAFLVCVLGGAIAGFISYKNRVKDIDAFHSREGIYSGAGGGLLLWRRIGILLLCAIGVYFLWQLAKSI